MGKDNDTAGHILLLLRLAKMKHSSKITSKEAAAIIGLSESQLYHLIKRRRSPTLGQAVRMKQVLKIPVESWVD